MKRIFIDLAVPCPECSNQPNYVGDVKAQVLMVDAKINVLGRDEVKYALICRRCAKALGMNGERGPGTKANSPRDTGESEYSGASRTPANDEELNQDE